MNSRAQHHAQVLAGGKPPRPVGARGPGPAESGEVTDWIERAESALAAAGHRRGGARRAVLELLDAQRCALTAVAIEDALRVAARKVSRASVYRILDELEGLRLVQRVDTGQAMVRYERVCEHDEHHHHLVCDGCGLVMPFADEALERAISSLSRRVPLTVSEHEIVLRGECQDCAA
ncbi:MAG TPA: Fur family transcriptional regulator [Solirubrobacteraceae bacterium]|jgi:Fur family ferric uptake transcriptional regulator